MHSVKFLLFSIAAFLAVSGIIYFSHAVRPCVPFAQKNLPDENDGHWTGFGKQSDPLNIETVELFAHKAHEGLNLAVYSYFGNKAVKAWACWPRDKGDAPDFTTAVLKDGKWFKTQQGAQGPHISAIHDEKGKEIAVQIALIDESGNLVHVIHRPK